MTGLPFRSPLFHLILLSPAPPSPRTAARSDQMALTAVPQWCPVASRGKSHSLASAPGPSQAGTCGCAALLLPPRAHKGTVTSGCQCQEAQPTLESLLPHRGGAMLPASPVIMRKRHTCEALPRCWPRVGLIVNVPRLFLSPWRRASKIQPTKARARIRTRHMAPYLAKHLQSRSNVIGLLFCSS